MAFALKVFIGQKLPNDQVSACLAWTSRIPKEPQSSPYP
jgi:hypothetical protein